MFNIMPILIGVLVLGICLVAFGVGVHLYNKYVFEPRIMREAEALTRRKTIKLVRKG